MLPVIWCLDSGDTRNAMFKHSSSPQHSTALITSEQTNRWTRVRLSTTMLSWWMRKNSLTLHWTGRMTVMLMSSVGVTRSDCSTLLRSCYVSCISALINDGWPQLSSQQFFVVSISFSAATPAVNWLPGFIASKPRNPQKLCIAVSWEGVNLSEKFKLIYILKVVKTGLYVIKWEHLL